MPQNVDLARPSSLAGKIMCGLRNSFKVQAVFKLDSGFTFCWLTQITLPTGAHKLPIIRETVNLDPLRSPLCVQHPRQCGIYEKLD